MTTEALGLFSVAGAYYAAQQRHLAALTPEQRAAHNEMILLARSLEIRRAIERGRREARKRLDREPEVLLARECIAREESRWRDRRPPTCLCARPGAAEGLQ